MQVLTPKQRKDTETLFFFIRKVTTKELEAGKSYGQYGENTCAERV